MPIDAYWLKYCLEEGATKGKFRQQGSNHILLLHLCNLDAQGADKVKHATGQALLACLYLSFPTRSAFSEPYKSLFSLSSHSSDSFTAAPTSPSRSCAAACASQLCICSADRMSSECSQNAVSRAFSADRICYHLPISFAPSLSTRYRLVRILHMSLQLLPSAPAEPPGFQFALWRAPCVSVPM